MVSSSLLEDQTNVESKAATVSNIAMAEIDTGL